MMKSKRSNRSAYPLSIATLLLTVLCFLLSICYESSFVPLVDALAVSRLAYVRQLTRAGTLHSSNEQNQGNANGRAIESNDKENWSIRKIRHSELGAVASIILNSFFSSEYQKGPFKHLVTMTELNRLQQNFPYSDQYHCMFAAVTNDTKEPKVIGFVDVDARPPQLKNQPPRPYLSDLCTHPDFRRKGIAKALVLKCQDIAIEQMNDEQLFIRVEQNNDAARSMYAGLGYHQELHEIFGVKDTTMLLNKKLKIMEEDLGAPSPSSVPLTNNNDTFPVLDYVV